MKETIMKIGITYEPVCLTQNDKISPTTLSCISLLKRGMEENGHEVILIKGIDALKKILIDNEIKLDFVFNAADGTEPGDSESYIPSLLRSYNIPYSGSDTSTLSICANKLICKYIALQNDITTPKFYYISAKQENINYKEIVDKLNFPIIVKPNKESCSIALYKVNTLNDLKSRINYIKNEFNYDILCEEFIYGLEATVPVLEFNKNPKALAVLVYYSSLTDKPIEDVFDIQNKFFDDIYTKIPSLDEDILNKLKDIGIFYHKLLQCHDYSRCDFKITSDGKIYFLEINPLPDLYPEGGFGTAAKMNNIDYPELLQIIINNALK